jgi:hypothetical protein
MIPRHLAIGVTVMLAISLAMSVYVWRMRVRVRQAETPVEYAHPVAAPVQGPSEQVTLYVAIDDPGSIRPQGANIPLPAGRQERAQELVRALLGLYLDKSSPHPLGPGADVRDVYLVDPGLAVIDLNDAFADGHRSGILVEELTVASLVQTLSANIPGINRVKILVGGKERETLAGHADLSCTYDVSAVDQMVRELQ